MASALEAGLVVDSDAVHAVRKRVDGLSAVCGAGKILRQVPGRFDPAMPNACEQCIDATVEVSPPSAG